MCGGCNRPSHGWTVPFVSGPYRRQALARTIGEELGRHGCIAAVPGGWTVADRLGRSWSCVDLDQLWAVTGHARPRADDAEAAARDRWRWWADLAARRALVHPRSSPIEVPHGGVGLRASPTVRCGIVPAVPFVVLGLSYLLARGGDAPAGVALPAASFLDGQERALVLVGGAYRLSGPLTG